MESADDDRPAGHLCIVQTGKPFYAVVNGSELGRSSLERRALLMQAIRYSVWNPHSENFSTKPRLHTTLRNAQTAQRSAHHLLEVLQVLQ
jgi:hypothetical protein